MSTKAWIIFAVICAVGFGGLVLLSQKDKVDVSNVNEQSIQPATAESGKIADHVFGNKDSKVVLMEYGDFQCPGCGSAYPVLKSVTEKYENELAFVFRNFPLTTIHPNARAAAGAVEAVGINGKYWEMHNIMYETQSEWKDTSANDRTTLFTQYAVQAGVRAETFTKTLKDDSSRINLKINFDQALGGKMDVTGTPTLYLNGKLIDEYVLDGKIVPQSTADAQPIWSDETAFDKLLLQPAFKKAGITIPTSTKK